MRFHFTSAAALATFATAVSAANIQVMVGGTQLQFMPNQVNASVGDTVEFIFGPVNHTVTQSSFAAPCQPMANGLDSNFQPVATGAANVPSFTVPVNATTPLWFFCRQTGHCEKGMVFAINPTANKTFAAFQAAANASSPTDGSPAANSSSPSSGSSSSTTAGSTSTSASPSSTSSSSKSNSSNAAAPGSARAGGVLAVVGFAVGLLL